MPVLYNQRVASVWMFVKACRKQYTCLQHDWFAPKFLKGGGVDPHCLDPLPVNAIAESRAARGVGRGVLDLPVQRKSKCGGAAKFGQANATYARKQRASRLPVSTIAPGVEADAARW